MQHVVLFNDAKNRDGARNRQGYRPHKYNLEENDTFGFVLSPQWVSNTYVSFQGDGAEM